MSNLVGKALEDDEAFWGHETWKEEDDDDMSGNDSFHESDEDSEHRKDAFDSDFNDSETDNEEEEEAAGNEEEARLQREEKKNKRRANTNKSYFDVAKAGRALLQKRKGRIKGTRVFGDGCNAGRDS